MLNLERFILDSDICMVKGRRLITFPEINIFKYSSIKHEVNQFLVAFNFDHLSEKLKTIAKFSDE